MASVIFFPIDIFLIMSFFLFLLLVRLTKHDELQDKPTSNAATVRNIIIVTTITPLTQLGNSMASAVVNHEYEYRLN